MWLLRAVVSSVLAALLAGCGTTGDDRGAPEQTTSTAAGNTQAAAAVPEGYRRVEDTAQGYALLLPQRWRDLPFSNAAAASAEFLADNPQMQAQVDALSEQGGLLLALDPDDDGVTNANLVSVESPATIDEEIEAGITQLEEAGARGLARDQVATAAGDDTETVTYELPINAPDGEVVLQQQQYFLKSDTSLYVLTLTTDDLSTNAGELTTIGESFQLLPAG